MLRGTPHPASTTHLESIPSHPLRGNNPPSGLRRSSQKPCRTVLELVLINTSYVARGSMRKLTLALNALTAVLFTAFFAYTFFAESHLQSLTRNFVTEKSLHYSGPEGRKGVRNHCFASSVVLGGGVCFRDPTDAPSDRTMRGRRMGCLD